MDLVDRAAAAVRQRDEELLRLQRVLEIVLGMSPPVIVTEQHVVRVWSAAAEEATGISAEAAMGRALSRVLPELGTEAAVTGGKWRVRGLTWNLSAVVQEGWRVFSLDPTSGADDIHAMAS